MQEGGSVEDLTVQEGDVCVCCVFFFERKTAYERLRSLVGSEMCIRDRLYPGQKNSAGGESLPCRASRPVVPL